MRWGCLSTYGVLAGRWDKPLTCLREPVTGRLHAFEHLPADWTDVAAETAVPRHGAVRVDAESVSCCRAR
jgi:hypothetical protein